MLDRRTLLIGFGISALSACATPTALEPPTYAPPLPPIDARPERLTHITVCLRPFRAMGPRLDVETIGAKRVVHNYGHGGSGWSLSWGSSAIATANALEGGTMNVAVIGCGALGLTSALTLQRAGANVTIYAKERTPLTRSVRATGSWSPDSRIADADRVDAGFPALWEQMARTSFAAHRAYLDLPGEPVAFHDRYGLSDPIPGGPGRKAPPDAIHFAAYGARVRDLTPHGRTLEVSENPFHGVLARKNSSMQFNITELTRLLNAEFVERGGRFVEATFHTPADFAALPETVIVNCTGYGARALFRDESITPVRGQIAWLAPQPEVTYSVIYHNVSTLSRPDGIVVQQVGMSDMWGYGVDDEKPDHAEARDAVSTIASLFAPRDMAHPRLARAPETA